MSVLDISDPDFLKKEHRAAKEKERGTMNEKKQDKALGQPVEDC
jgi:hypothetical protein